MSRWLVNGIALLVSVVWGASFLADIFIKGYDPSPFIHLAMMTIVGAAFSHQFLSGKKSNGNGNGNGNGNNS